MDLHFETHLFLQANNEMYMWNQVNCTKNHYANVGTSSPYNQWSYPMVSCPRQVPYNVNVHVKKLATYCGDPLRSGNVKNEDAMLRIEVLHQVF